MPYDAKKAHTYYEEHKKLKGRNGPAGSPVPPPKVGQGSRIVESGNANSALHPGTKPKPPVAAEAVAKVNRLKAAVSKLEGALSEARAALSKKRQEATKTAKANSDGNSTQKEKAASKTYRDKNKAKLATTRKAAAPAAASTPASSSTSSVASMSATDLQARIISINSALANAKRQLSTAQQSLGHMAHTAITSEPTFDEHFARFRSAERRPST